MIHLHKWTRWTTTDKWVWDKGKIISHTPAQTKRCTVCNKQKMTNI